MHDDPAEEIRRSISNLVMRTIRDGTRSLNEVRPLPGRHSASVIILHGLGDSAEGMYAMCIMHVCVYMK